MTLYLAKFVAFECLLSSSHLKGIAWNRESVRKNTLIEDEQLVIESIRRSVISDELLISSLAVDHMEMTTFSVGLVFAFGLSLANAMLLKNGLDSPLL